MKFTKLKKAESNQSILLFKSKKFKIYGSFNIEEEVIQKIELSLKGKKVHIKSALLCANVVNQDSYYLQINVKEEASKNEKPFNVDISDSKFIVKKGTLVFTNVLSYSKEKDEINSCKIDIFDIEYNPKVRDGRIIITE